MMARIGTFRDTQKPLSPASRRALMDRGIDKLFKHQAEAIDAATDGKAAMSKSSPEMENRIQGS